MERDVTVEGAHVSLAGDTVPPQTDSRTLGGACSPAHRADTAQA